MHLWSDPSTSSNALRIEAAGQRCKQTAEFMYLGGAISESTDLDTEIKRRGVHRGSYSARRLKALKVSHIWAAGGARAHARRPSGNVLAGLPPEKPRGLWGDLAQRQRAEMGRIRSCCQGWMGLDDCCQEHGHVAPEGREGSGITR